MERSRPIIPMSMGYYGHSPAGCMAQVGRSDWHDYMGALQYSTTRKMHDLDGQDSPQRRCTELGRALRHQDCLLTCQKSVEVLQRITLSVDRGDIAFAYIYTDMIRSSTRPLPAERTRRERETSTST